MAIGRSETIGEWTPQQLTKYLQAALREDEIVSATIKTFDELIVNRLLTILDEVKFGQAQTTVGSAGGAAALPATPLGYLRVLEPGGTVVLVPYFRAP